MKILFCSNKHLCYLWKSPSIFPSLFTSCLESRLVADWMKSFISSLSWVQNCFPLPSTVLILYIVNLLAVIWRVVFFHNPQNLELQEKDLVGHEFASITNLFPLQRESGKIFQKNVANKNQNPTYNLKN